MQRQLTCWLDALVQWYEQLLCDVQSVPAHAQSTVPPAVQAVGVFTHR